MAQVRALVSASLRADHLDDLRHVNATMLAMSGSQEQIQRFIDAVPGESPVPHRDDDTTAEALAAFGIIEVPHGR